MVSKKMQPPWIESSSHPAGHIYWRMGAGEAYLQDFVEWISASSQEERLDYLSDHSPLPAQWVLWAVDILALPETEETALDAAFAALVTRGLVADET